MSLCQYVLSSLFELEYVVDQLSLQIYALATTYFRAVHGPSDQGDFLSSYGR